MSIINYDIPSIEHPEWCAAPFCSSPHPHDCRHSTVPVPMYAAPLDDVEITLARMRDDEYVPSTSEWHRKEGVLLRLFNTESVTLQGEDTTAEVLMPRATVHRLIRELQALYAQVWGDAAAGSDLVPEHYCPMCGSAIIRGYCSNPCCPSWVDADGAL